MRRRDASYQASRRWAVTERAGFRDFVASNSEHLLRAGWLLCGDWALAEDLVQMALVKVLPRWAAITDAARLSYVRVALYTTFISWRRKRWTSELSMWDVPESPRPDAAFGRVDGRAGIYRVLGGLPPRQRAVVVLRYFEDLTEAQTAEVLGCSVGAVKSYASRAMDRLRREPGLAELLREGIES